MANTFKKVIDRMMWVQVAPTPNAHAAGISMCSDLRNTVERNPFVYQLVSATTLNRFNIVTKAWSTLTVSLGLSGTFGAGAGCVFAPSFSVKGAVAAGSTSSLVTTSTVLAAVGLNMLANRGGSGDYGFKVRIIGSSAGGSGKTEERWIVGNTAGTTPTLALDTPLTFTPATGDVYEILGGKVWMLNAGTTAAAIWRSFDVVTNAIASGASTTNLPATISTDFAGVALDERYVPHTRKPGEGFLVGASTYDGTNLGCLLATGIAASSITGQASAGDAAVLANEYRNFQIRIVEDTTTPTAVGQRRIIASHTAGPSSVYTLGTAWTVNPSANAKFVIENPNLIVVRSTATTSLYVYNYTDATINNGTNSIAAGNWSVAYFAAGSSAMGAGCTIFPSWGIVPDTNKYARHSFIHIFRGVASTFLDVFNIAGGTTGSWEATAVYDGAYPSLTTGSCGKYSPFDNEGRFGYLNIYTASLPNQIYRYDVKNRVLSPFTPTDWLQSGTAAAGDRLAAYAAIDGTDRYSVLMLVAHTSSVTQELVVTV